MIRLADEAFDPYQELLAFGERAEGAGAIASFTGVVRGNAGGERVRALFIDHHPAFCGEALKSALAGARERWRLTDGLIIHRVGEVLAGKPIVLVAAASAHRGEAFAACAGLADFLKCEAPFWKQEFRASGPVWIEPTKGDHDAALRWRERKGLGDARRR